MAELNEGEICVHGNKYRIVGTSDESQDIAMRQYAPISGVSDSERLDTLISKLDVLVDVMGAGSSGGGYRSINLTLPPRERKYEVRLGLLSSQINIRADQGLIVTLNSESGEDIFIEIAEFPFALSGLRKNEAVHTIYFTTGANTTKIKIFAVGMVH
jgi:hypothetical protein